MGANDSGQSIAEQYHDLPMHQRQLLALFTFTQSHLLGPICIRLGI